MIWSLKEISQDRSDEIYVNLLQVDHVTNGQLGSNDLSSLDPLEKAGTLWDNWTEDTLEISDEYEDDDIYFVKICNKVFMNW